VFTSSGETDHRSPVSPFYQSLLLCLLQNGHLLSLRHGMQVRLLLLGERKESPGKFPNGTANDPAQRAVRGQHPAMLCNFLVICRGAIVQASFLCLTCGSPAAIMRGVESLDWVNNS
jgi:hypothetical protein